MTRPKIPPPMPRLQKKGGQIMSRAKGRVSDAMEILTEAMKNDPNYAHAWHDNIAVMMQDAGCEYEIANDGAARFMKLAFDVDTTNKKE